MTAKPARFATQAGLALVAAISLVALGAAAAISVTQPAVPRALGQAVPPASIDVTSEPFDDSRAVQLTIVSGGAASLISPASGTLTQFDCTTGGSLVSGTTPMAVDGRRILVLATSTPLWRDLAAGSTGADVSAVQAEFLRLGLDTRADGEKIGPATLRAFAQLQGDRSAKAIQLSQVAWIPEARTQVLACAGALGQRVQAGTDLATLPPKLKALRPTSLPERLLPGPRTLEVDGLVVDTDGDGAVSDPAALAKIAATPAFAAAQADPTRPATGQLALKTPQTVSVLPASAVAGTASGQCVFTTAGTSVPVKVVGSQLGQSFVTFAATAPKQVLTTIPQDATCGSP